MLVKFFQKKKNLAGTEENSTCRFDAILILLVFPFAILMFIRTWFNPLISPDSVFRWNHLAIMIFKTGSLNFYPPATAVDFFKYPYPDGFPPLVSVVYYWIYASAGTVAPSLTAFIVCFQFVATSYYLYSASLLILRNRISALFSVVGLMLSCVFFFSLMLGQETGWTALAAAAMLFYSAKLAKSGDSDIRHAVLCAVSVAIGVSTREYGIIFFPLAFFVLKSMKVGLSRILIVMIVSGLISAPFYLRNILLFGNPLYPLSVAGFLPHNVVHKGIMDEYASVFGLFSNSDNLKTAIRLFLIGLPAQITAFFLSFFFIKRKIRFPLVFTSSIFLAIWIYSTYYTCGGIFYSMRVLSPFIVVSSILFAAIATKLYHRLSKKNDSTAKLIATVMISGALLVAFTFDTSVPRNVFKTGLKSGLNQIFSRQAQPEKLIFKYAEALPNGSVVLNDSALYSAENILNGNGSFRMLPLWSPELLFLFDDRQGFKRQIEILENLGITHIMLTNDSINNKYFQRFNFFREYPKRLPVIAIGNDSTIFSVTCR